MERDRKLLELFREHGIIKAPESLTSEVIRRIEKTPERIKYKPLINRLTIIIVTAVCLILLIVWSKFGHKSSNGHMLSLPDWHFEIPDVSPLFTTGIAAGFLALFVLLLSESGLKRRKGKI